jgi:hypothetical protein
MRNLVACTCSISGVLRQATITVAAGVYYGVFLTGNTQGALWYDTNGSFPPVVRVFAG